MIPFDLRSRSLSSHLYFGWLDDRILSSLDTLTHTIHTAKNKLFGRMNCKSMDKGG